VSAQEAAYNIVQLRMCESSVKTVFISTAPPHLRCRILKSTEELEKLAGSDSNIYVSGDVKHYSERPDSLSGLNFAKFVAWFEYSKKARKSTTVDDSAEIVEADIGNTPSQDDDTNSKYIALNNNSGYVKKRKNPKVLKYHHSSIDTDLDLYFYHLVRIIIKIHVEIGFRF
jgi:hypothetical protein